MDRQTRDHSDLEVAVLDRDLGLIRRHLAGYVFHSVGDGTVVRLGAEETRWEGDFQHWVLDPTTNKWKLDLMVVPGDQATWAYRRDPTLTAPVSFMCASTPDGITYLRPHGTLLFKARHMRPKDHADFENCLPAMTVEEPLLAEGGPRALPPWP